MAEDIELKLFVSSPGDVQRERERIDYVVARLNAEYKGRVQIKTIRWETSYYSSHDTFQSQIPEAATCDLVVAVFGSRLGSVLPETFPPMPTGERYPSGSAYEVLTAIEARRRGRSVPDIYVFRRPSAPMVALDAADRDEIETQWRRLTGFFETWFRNRSGEFLAAFQEFSSTDEFAAKVEDCLRQWLARHGFPPVVATWDRRKRGSPYPGLAAFDESRQSVMFGRSVLIGQALRRLRDIEAPAAQGASCPFLLLIGASGSGKSSLLRAGVLPKVALPGVLPEVDMWRRAVTTPGLNPFDSLAESLLGAEALGPELAGGAFASHAMLAKQLSADPDIAVAPLREALGAAAETRRQEQGYAARRPARLFLAIDQAERLLLECAPDLVNRFAALIATLCRSRLATVVFVLRSDAYPQFQAVDALVELRAAGATLDVLPPTVNELEDMATEPAALCDPPLAFEQRNGRSLATALVADAEGGDALPLLQMTLARLCAAEAGRGDGVLRFADYAGLGEAVSGAANEAMAALDPAARSQLPNLIVGLVRDFATDPASGKPAATIGALDRARFEARRPERKALVEALVTRRLLTAEGDAASQRVRPTHESLLRIWPEAVAILVESAHLIRSRAAVEPLARDWRDAPTAERERHLEVSPALLEGAVAYVERFGDEVTPATRDFVAAAAAAAEERRGRERREQEKRIADAEAIARANKKIALTTAIGLAAALALAGTAGWQWRVSVQAQREAQAQRERAEHALAAATATADGLIFDMAQKFRYAPGVAKPLVKQILDQARKLQEQLLGSGETSVKLTSNHAAALGEIATTELALGDAADALTLAVQARDIYAKLVAATPGASIYLYDLAHTEAIAGDIHRQQGKLGEAGDAYQRARAALDLAASKAPADARFQRLKISILMDMGALERARDDLPRAMERCREALALAQTLARTQPDDLETQHDLAISYRNLGDVELASDAQDAADADFSAAAVVALKLAQDHRDNTLLQRDYTLSQERLGEALTKKGDLAGALKAFRDGEATAIEMAKTDPANLDWRYDVSIGHVEVGDTQLALADPKGAAASFREAVEIDRELVKKDESNVFWRDHFAAALVRWGNALKQAGDSDGALSAYNEAVAFDRRSFERNPADTGPLKLEITVADDVGVLLLGSGKLDEAIVLFKDMAEKARSVGSERWGRELLLANMVHLAGALALKGDAGSALDRSQEGAAIARALIAENPKDVASRGELALLLIEQAHIQSQAGRKPDAPASLREAIALCGDLARDAPTQPLWRQELAIAFDSLGNALQESGDIEGALDALKSSVAAAEALPEAVRRSRNAEISVSMTREALARLLDQRKQMTEAVDAIRAAIATRKTLRDARPDDDLNARTLMIDFNVLGEKFNRLGRSAEALAAYREGQEIARSRAKAPGADVQARHDLAVSLFLTGSELFKMAQPGDAAAAFGEALPLANALAAASPANLTYSRLASLLARNLGGALTAAKDLPGALRASIAARDADKAILASPGATRADADGLKSDVAQIGLVCNAMLLERQFDASLAALDQAAPAAPDQNWLDLIRAADLMFTNHVEEARRLLIKHRGETTYGGKAWEQAAVDGFQGLRSHGLSHPLMDEIEAMFKQPK